jgi:hypothetical protein
MSLPFTKGNNQFEDEPSVDQGKSRKHAKRLWGMQFFMRISFHKVTRIVRTQSHEAKGELLRLASVADTSPAPEPPPATTETHTTDKNMVFALGVMPPNDGAPQ